MAAATKSRKASKKLTKTANVEKVIPLFQGTVAATKLFKRTMPEFKNCKAICWMIFNESTGTVTFANSYNGETPKSSFDQKTYTYAYKPKVHDPKMDEMTEVDVTDWPAWVTNAGRRSRKTK